MAGQPSKPAPKENHGLGVKSYLFLYNGVQVAGWFYLLYQTITHYLQGGTTGNLWPVVGTTLLYFQNAAIIEVINVMLGYVRSPLLITLMQVASRLMVVSALLYPMPPVQTSYGLPLIIAAWSVTEIVRYSFYALSIIKAVPYFLVWCRYTFFYALYPIGVSGELILYYAAQQYVAETKMATYEMPNTLNFIFNFRYLLIGIMLIYIPQFPQLFGYMLTQRKKVIGGGSTSQKSKKN